MRLSIGINLSLCQVSRVAWIGMHSYAAVKSGTQQHAAMHGNSTFSSKSVLCVANLPHRDAKWYSVEQSFSL